MNYLLAVSDYSGKSSYESTTKTNYYYRENYVLIDWNTEKKLVAANDNYIIIYEIKGVSRNI